MRTFLFRLDQSIVMIYIPSVLLKAQHSFTFSFVAAELATKRIRQATNFGKNIFRILCEKTEWKLTGKVRERPMLLKQN